MGRRGERRGVARRSGLEGAEELEVEVGVELELELELELVLGLPAAAPVDVGEVVHKSFTNRFIIHQFKNWLKIDL